MKNKKMKTESKKSKVADIKEVKKAIAARFKSFRKGKGLTQTELGEILKINFQHISKYERGEFIPTFENLIKLIDHFSININWLLTGEGAMYYEDKNQYKITEEQLARVIRDEDEKLGEIMEILKKNDRLKLAVYEFLQSLKQGESASRQLQLLGQEIMMQNLKLSET